MLIDGFYPSRIIRKVHLFLFQKILSVKKNYKHTMNQNSAETSIPLFSQSGVTQYFPNFSSLYFKNYNEFYVTQY